MKILLSLLSSILLCGIADAQNYQCVQTSTINYFTNSDNYLRAIRIDSVKTINGNTVLYPFKTARGEYFGSSNPLKPGGSWLGATITIVPDGTHWFENYRGDTVIINTQALLNDSWILYNDTAGTYYEATVINVGTMTVLGILDSVKIISLTAKDQNGIITTNTLHNRKIIISKNHGLVQTLDLYIFPRQEYNTYGFDYFTNEAWSIDFTISNFHNPDKLEIYDFQPGDVFQRYGCTNQKYIFTYFSDSIIHKTFVGAGHVQYTIRSISLNHLKHAPSGTTETFIDTVVVNVYSGPLLDMVKLPEEWGSQRFIFYNENDTNFCSIGKHYTYSPNFVSYSGNSSTVNTFEPCGGPTYTYKTGTGELSYSYCFDPTGFNPYWYTTYIRKNGLPCRKYKSLSISETINTAITTIFPNPASDNITIETPGINQPLQLMIYDLTGKIIYDGHTRGNRTQIPVNDFTNGYYLLRLLLPDGLQSNHKIVVQH